MEEPGETEEDGNKKKPPGTPNWTTPEVLACIYAVLAANRQKAEATQVARARAARDAYPRFCAQLVKQRVWIIGGVEGHPTIEESTAWRTVFTETGKNKGKSPLFSKYADTVKVVQNHIIPLLGKVLGPGYQPPSGHVWPDVLNKLKMEYWSFYREGKKRLRDKTSMPDGKKQGRNIMYGLVCITSSHFCIPRSLERALLRGLHRVWWTSPHRQRVCRLQPGGLPTANSQVAGGRASAREREAQRKRQKREEQRNLRIAAETPPRSAVGAPGVDATGPVAIGLDKQQGSTASALQGHTRVWQAQLLMSFGSAEQKAEVMAALFQEWKAGQAGQRVSGEVAQTTSTPDIAETGFGDGSSSFLLEKEGVSAVSGGFGAVAPEGTDTSDIE